MTYELRVRGRLYLKTESKTEALGTFSLLVFQQGKVEVKLWLIEGKTKEIIAESA
jgi:hypothetical protein